MVLAYQIPLPRTVVGGQDHGQRDQHRLITQQIPAAPPLQRGHLRVLALLLQAHDGQVHDPRPGVAPPDLLAGAVLPLAQPLPVCSVVIRHCLILDRAGRRTVQYDVTTLSS